MQLLNSFFSNLFLSKYILKESLYFLIVFPHWEWKEKGIKYPVERSVCQAAQYSCRRTSLTGYCVTGPRWAAFVPHSSGHLKLAGYESECSDVSSCVCRVVAVRQCCAALAPLLNHPAVCTTPHQPLPPIGPNQEIQGKLAASHWPPSSRGLSILT